MITADTLIGCCFVSMAIGIGISLLLKGQVVIVGDAVIAYRDLLYYKKYLKRWER